MHPDDVEFYDSFGHTHDGEKNWYSRNGRQEHFIPRPIAYSKTDAFFSPRLWYFAIQDQPNLYTCV